MKKNRRLKLNGETLRRLDGDALSSVGGGTWPDTNCGVPSACWAATCTKTGCPECSDVVGGCYTALQ